MSELPRLTSIAIREWLLTVKQGSPYDFWKEFRRQISEKNEFLQEVAKTRKPARKPKPLKIPVYTGVWRYFYIMHRIGLLRRVQKGGLMRKKSLYAIASGVDLLDDRWSHPQVELYPSTRWGGRRYGRAVEEGKVEFGANPRYV